MDLTQGSFEEKRTRSKKNMMWFAMISMTMTFAGLTSAVIVSRSRKDWFKDFDFPSAFIWSTALIVLSSFTFLLAKKCIENNNRLGTTLALLSTLSLGLLFIYLQRLGFQELFDQGLVPAGQTAEVTISFLFVIVALHVAHVMGGIIALLVVIYNHFKQKYKAGQALGLELGAMYWHFVDILWLYLFLFLYFFR